jgi:Domain of unknown function (DUF4263)
MAKTTKKGDHEEKPAQQLRDEFLALLDEGHSEQLYQEFVEKNTRLIPREFVQNHGIHFDLVLRKLSFGADYKSDFAYLSKSSDDWNCVLVEIERPTAHFFRSQSTEFHPDFVKATQQIGTWRAWLSEAMNKAAFADNTIGLIRVPLGRNITYPKFVLVHGRRSEYKGDRIRRNLIAAQERDDFKIMTFDSLAEGLHAKHDLYVGVRKNEYIDIVSDVFLSESMFCWMEPEHLRIGRRLKASALAARGQWHHYMIENGKSVLTMDVALPRVRLRKDRAP